ncbi:MAG TPA: response regulator transcription factor [Bryobacterales bacterium]|nr:response regulator transcription factor [Bryobacterales bacterium]
MATFSDVTDRQRRQSPCRPPGRRIRILVAHDEPLFRDGLAKLLALEADFHVVAEAKNGAQALDLLPRCKPDIVLLDLKMPGVGGLATLEKLQSQRTRARVIVLTAPGDERPCADAMRLGACGIVPKQLAAECLAACIRQVHSGEIWLGARAQAALLAQSLTPPETAAADGERSLLSPRERQIVALVAQGLKNKQIAEQLFISDQTVKNHLHNIFDKVGAGDRLELALYAIQNRIGAHETQVGR